jgi:hypothetical protein
MSYGANGIEPYGRAASIIDKILKGPTLIYRLTNRQGLRS